MDRVARAIGASRNCEGRWKLKAGRSRYSRHADEALWRCGALPGRRGWFDFTSPSALVTLKSTFRLTLFLLFGTFAAHENVKRRICVRFYDVSANAATAHELPTGCRSSTCRVRKTCHAERAPRVKANRSSWIIRAGRPCRPHYPCLTREYFPIQGYIPVPTRPEHIVHLFRDVHVHPITKDALPNGRVDLLGGTMRPSRSARKSQRASPRRCAPVRARFNNAEQGRCASLSSAARTVDLQAGPGLRRLRLRGPSPTSSGGVSRLSGRLIFEPSRANWLALSIRRQPVLATARRILELAQKAEFLYKSQDRTEQRRLLEIVLLNCT